MFAARRGGSSSSGGHGRGRGRSSAPSDLRLTHTVAIPRDIADVFTGSLTLMSGADADHNITEARTMLLDAMRAAAPVMRRRSLRVVDVVEIYPSSAWLHGWNANAGERIGMRLRHAGSARALIDPESVLHTLMHELTHNVYGSHSADFYDMLDKLHDEAQSVAFRRRHGVHESSDGRFWGEGRVLGGSIRRESRLLTSSSSSSSSISSTRAQRLGGDATAVHAGVPQRELLARAALRRLQNERKLHDDHACGDHAHDAPVDIASQDTEDGVEVVEEDVVVDLVDGDDDDDDDDDDQDVAGEEIEKSDAAAAAAGTGAAAPCSPPTTTAAATTKWESSPRSASPSWTCATCTLVNRLDHLQCYACLAMRPHDPSTATAFPPSPPSRAPVPTSHAVVDLVSPSASQSSDPVGATSALKRTRTDTPGAAS